MSIEAVGLYGQVMKEWHKDNPPTQAKINALLVVIKNWRERYETVIKMLEKWDFAESLMRDNVDFMYCSDIKLRLEKIIADSKQLASDGKSRLDTQI